MFIHVFALYLNIFSLLVFLFFGGGGLRSSNMEEHRAIFAIATMPMLACVGCCLWADCGGFLVARIQW